jgi:hypothetical protein
MPVASATPGAFDNTNSVADPRESSRQNFLRARNVGGLNRAPLANPKKAVAAAPTMRAGIQHEALASSKRVYLTQTSPVFERIIGNPTLSSAAIES